jgi:hypothetical protein
MAETVVFIRASPSWKRCNVFAKDSSHTIYWGMPVSDHCGRRKRWIEFEQGKQDRIQLGTRKTETREPARPYLTRDELYRGTFSSKTRQPASSCNWTERGMGPPPSSNFQCFSSRSSRADSTCSTCEQPNKLESAFAPPIESRELPQALMSLDTHRVPAVIEQNTQLGGAVSRSQKWFRYRTT